MKTYTDIEQSKKLAEILPLESADAFYIVGKNPVDIVPIYGSVTHQYLREQIAYGRAVPCWSLTALFELMPSIGVCAPVLVKCILENKYYCHYMGIGSHKEVHTTAFYDQSIDAAYEMIIKLKERNLL